MSDNLTPFVCVKDFEDYARLKLSKPLFDYIYGGSDDEFTLSRNTAAFKRLLVRPRMLRDVANIDTSITLLGGKVPIGFPICIAPTASHKMVHPHGEIATAKAASELGTLMTLSMMSTTRLEDVSNAAPNGVRFMQLYLYKDKNATIEIIRRAKKAGFRGLVITIDSPVTGKRRGVIKNSFALPSHLKMENFIEVADSVKERSDKGYFHLGSYFDTAMTWASIDWLKTVTDLPIMVKGLLTAEDAVEACEHGVDGIFVSNHGARQLDSTPATIEVLPEIVKAVNGRCDVYLDGGVRSGMDAFKALALGAKAVFVGRPYIWGLAFDGKNGVKMVMNIMKQELENTMKLAGCRTISEIQTAKSLVVHESFYSKI